MSFMSGEAMKECQHCYEQASHVISHPVIHELKKRRKIDDGYVEVVNRKKTTMALHLCDAHLENFSKRASLQPGRSPEGEEQGDAEGGELL